MTNIPPLQIGDIRGWAVGLLGIRLPDFLLLRVGEFWEAMAAYRREKELDRRHMGELARGAALRIFNIQLAPKDRVSDPAQFWLMPWDDEKEAPDATLQMMTEEERRENAKEFLKRINWE